MKRNKFFTSHEERARVIDTVEDVIVADLNIEQSELEIYKIVKNAIQLLKVVIKLLTTQR